MEDNHNSLENQLNQPADSPELVLDEKNYPAEPKKTEKSETAEPKEPKPKKTKSKIIMLAVAAVAVIAVGVFAVVAATLPKSKPIQEPISNTAEPTSEGTPVSELRLSGNSLSDFDLRFLQLENEAKNKIYSPLSIKYALGMLQEGAAGNTKAQIDALIGDYTPKNYLNSEHRSLANALFVRDTFKENVLENYLTTLSSKYGAAVIYDQFANANAINGWVSEQTLGQINNLLDDGSVSSKDFILANALAIDMNWNNQLQCSASSSSVPCLRYSVSYTHEKYSVGIAPIMKRENTEGYDAMNFNGNNNAKSVEIGASINNYDIIKEIGEEKIRSTVRAAYEEWLAEQKTNEYYIPNEEDDNVEGFLNSYMEGLGSNYGQVDISTDFLMSDDENVKVFAKDLQEYDGSTLQYVGIMPKTISLTDYVKNLSAEKLNNIISGLKEIKTSSFEEGVVTKIVGHLPLFEYDYELGLIDDLTRLGVTDVFDREKADLSNLLSIEGGFIAEATHKANIEFSNDGIKAAAATIMSGLGSSRSGFQYDWDVPVEEIDLTFDKPFVFLIRDKATGEVWFAGTVYEAVEND